MIASIRLIPRIALFSALVYVLSWGTSFLPNINFIFFIVFSAGFMWGVAAGVLVGVFGMGLWSLFNPYGPAIFPVLVAQLVGVSFSGMIGSFFKIRNWQTKGGWKINISLIISAVLCTIFFYFPVNVVDAWVFQPFWPRFYTGMFWALISLGSNVIIFPLLFRALRFLYIRERAL